jgi:hypothetical protein
MEFSGASGCACSESRGSFLARLKSDRRGGAGCPMGGEEEEST